MNPDSTSPTAGRTRKPPVPPPGSRNRPLTIVMLHGRGVPGPGETWPSLVQDAVLEVGVANLESARFRSAHLMAPSYAFLTRPGTPPTEVMTADVNIPRPAGIRRMSHGSGTPPKRDRLVEDLTVLWGTPGIGEKPGGLITFLSEVAAETMDDFKDYLTNRETKDSVRNWLVNRVPANADLIVIGHSMGSLVALDLLHDLPSEVRVIGLITLGSPLAYEPFHRLLEDHHLSHAAGRAGSWINIVDPRDQVTGGAALATSWRSAAHCVDVCVDNGPLADRNGEGRHSGSCYMQQPAFGVALDRLINWGRPAAAWNPATELAVVRERYPGGSNEDVAFRARLRAIWICRNKRGYAEVSSPWGSPFSDAVQADYTLGNVVSLFAWITSAFWTADGRYGDQTTKCLTAMLGERPFYELIPIAQVAASEAGKVLSTVWPDYEGLPPESPLWDQVIAGVTPCQRFSIAGKRGQQYRFLHGATTDDEIFFTLLKASIEIEAYRALTRRGHGNMRPLLNFMRQALELGQLGAPAQKLVRTVLERYGPEVWPSK